MLNPMNHERQVYAAVVGRLIQRSRAKLNERQEDLATRAGLSQSALSRFENGQSLPDLFELRALARALEEEPEEFVAKTERAFTLTREAADKVAPGAAWADVVASGVLSAVVVVGVAALFDRSSKRARPKG